MQRELSTTSERLPLLRHRKVYGPMEISRLRRSGILAGVWIASFLQALNTTLVATLVSSISSEFHHSNEASWLGTSFLLATCTFTPLYGRLCNVAGRRAAILAAITFCGVGTLACGLSSNMQLLVAARFFAGIGGGGIYTTASICAADMFPMRERTLVQGVAEVFQGVGLGVGGLLGGYISDRFGWRWAFLGQIPLFVIAFVLVLLNLTYVTPEQGKNTKEVLKRIDFMGSATLLCTVGSCLVFLSFKYNQDLPWDDIRVLGSIMICASSGLLFIVVELYIAPEPIVSPSMLKQRVPVLVGLSNLMVSSCNYSVTYHLPMWFETVQGTSASLAGLHLMPNFMAMSLGSLFAAFIMHRTGKYRPLMLLFGLLPAVGTLSIARLNPSSPLILQWIDVIPLGLGNGATMQATLMALWASLPHSQMAVGTGFAVLFRGVGQVSGVAVSAAIFQSLLDKHLHERITGPGSDEVIRRIRHSFRDVRTLPSDQQMAARISFEKSLRAVFYFTAATAALGYLMRLPIPQLSLDRPQGPTKPVPGARGEDGPEDHRSQSSDRECDY